MSNYQAARSENDEEILLAFAQNLRVCRQAKELSQEELAFQAGFSRSYYSEIETGKRNISLLNLVKLLSVLEIDANTLLSLPEQPR